MAKRLLSLLLLLAFCSPSTMANSSALSSEVSTVFSDDFDDNVINSSIWTASVSGSGPTIAEVNQRLEISLPGGSQDGSGSIFSANCTNRCTLSGDFDVQVDYQVMTWPTANGVPVGLSASGGAGVVERVGLLATPLISLHSQERYI